MNRKLMILSFGLFLNTVVFAQVTKEPEEDEEEEIETGFKKYNLFTGGNVAVNFGQGVFSFGVGPYFGYSINKYVDVAVALNYNYISQRDFFEVGDKIRQSVISPGAFVRVYPVKFLFAHGQYDRNFIQIKNIPPSGGTSAPFRYKETVSSFLVGPGFANGRQDERSFYYISVLFDVLKRPTSPYIDGQGRITPIFRAGYNIALFGKTESISSRKKRGIY